MASSRGGERCLCILAGLRRPAGVAFIVQRVRTPFPAAWEIRPFLWKWLQRAFSQPSGSNLHSPADIWSDTLLDELSRASESRIYEMRALNWINMTLAPWESSLVPSLYHCTASLPASHAAKAMCGFFRTSGSSLGLEIKDRQIHVTGLWTTIGPEAYWKMYKTLLDGIQSKKGHSDDDVSALITVCSSLQLALCLTGESVEPQILLPGLTQLAKLLSGQDLKIPLDIESSVVATLTHIGTQEQLDLPIIDETSMSLLESFTVALVPPPGQPVSPAFLSLSLICLRIWSRGLVSTYPSWAVAISIQEDKTGWTHLIKLLSAMQSFVQSGQSSAASLITHWITFAFEDNLVNTIANRDEKDALVALQELALTFRKAHNDGIHLAKDILERIDVLIVKVCSSEAVCATFSSARYSGTEDPFSQFPIAQPVIRSELSGYSSHPDSLRGSTVFENINKNAIYPRLVDNTENMLVFVRLMRCAARKLAASVNDDPTLFISLVSGSLALALHYEPENPEPELVAEFGTLLDAAASFVHLHNASDVQAHTTSITKWLIRLKRLTLAENSLLKKSPPCAIYAQALLNAVRDGNTIEGLKDMETLSQLRDWESFSHDENTTSVGFLPMPFPTHWHSGNSSPFVPPEPGPLFAEGSRQSWAESNWQLSVPPFGYIPTVTE
ncbi:hypothetical protein C8R44DRAFT_862823 [Mycena epipterygia]|nr:hypothetical protein C8R44DRAFT_862823 [Mycena epipterygia]